MYHESVMALVKVSTQVEQKLLRDMRAIAKEEGRQLQAIFDEAFKDYIDKRKGSQPRANVMAHYKASVARFGPLYERLAK